MLGRTISHFRILSKIGEGGMGEVYLAEDENLRRRVALKVLPVGQAGSEERRLRLIREARTAASVNHPNVAAIHEIGEEGGIVFIAMEHIEGETLRVRLRGQALTFHEVMKIGVSVCEGLVRAHEAHVVHRDLKPENIMIARDGQTKILDFGLARFLEKEVEAPSPGASGLATITSHPTREGWVVGTTAYMSPEQARGEALDTRSDVFSFGIVLYEMVTGKTPFAGPTVMDTLSAILREPLAPAASLDPDVSPELDRILGKCLEKDPDERYQNTRDLLVDLRHLLRDSDARPGPGSSPAAAPIRRRSPAISKRALIVLTVGLGLGLSGVAVLALLQMTPRERIDTTSGESQEIKTRKLTANPTDNAVIDAALAPDGKFLAYCDLQGLHVLSTVTGETRTIAPSSPGSPGVGTVRWMPDGARLLIITAEGNNVLWSYSVMNESRRRLAEGLGWDFSVSPDGTRIVYGDRGSTSVWIMPSEGGSARRVVAAEGGERIKLPGWSPDGHRIVYVVERKTEGGESRSVIESVTEDGEDPVVILRGSASLRVTGLSWLASGRLAYVLRASSKNPGGSEPGLWEVPVDVGSARPLGSPRKITTTVGDEWSALSSSADGRRLALIGTRWQSDVYVAELQDGVRLAHDPQRWTLDERRDTPFGWSPDGSAVLFNSDRLGSMDVFAQRAAGPTAEKLVGGEDWEWGTSATTDGAWLLFWRWSRDDVGKGLPPRLMRAPLAGGPAEAVLDPREIHPSSSGEEPGEVRCFAGPRASTGGACILSESVDDGRTLVLHALDVLGGRGRELARIQEEGQPGSERRIEAWALSPDGSAIALANSDGVVSTGLLSDLVLRPIPLAEGWRVQSLSWASDGRSLFMTGWSGSDCLLLRLDLDGKTSVLWRRKEAILNPHPSPDGRRIALQVGSGESNVWMFEDF